MWKFFLGWTRIYLSCIIALLEKPSGGGVVLAEFHLSIGLSQTSPGKVRMCGAIHIDWWIKWAAERTRMNFVFVYLCLLLILILPGHGSTHGTSMLCLIFNEVLYHALISLLSHTPVWPNTSISFLLWKKHIDNHCATSFGHSHFFPVLNEEDPANIQVHLLRLELNG